MASTNSSPTLEEVRNIEKEWNATLESEYTAMQAKYPAIKLEDLKPTIVDWLPLRSDLHPDTGDAIVLGWNKKTRSRIEVTPEIINCLKKYSLKVDEGDDCIFHTFNLKYDSDDMITGCIYHSHDLEDRTEKDASGNDVVRKGIKTLLGEGKVSILTRDDGIKCILVAD